MVLTECSALVAGCRKQRCREMYNSELQSNFGLPTEPAALSIVATAATTSKSGMFFYLRCVLSHLELKVYFLKIGWLEFTAKGSPTRVISNFTFSIKNGLQKTTMLLFRTQYLPFYNK